MQRLGPSRSEKEGWSGLYYIFTVSTFIKRQLWCVELQVWLHNVHLCIWILCTANFVKAIKFELGTNNTNKTVDVNMT